MYLVGSGMLREGFRAYICFKSLLMAITGSDILSCSVLSEMMCWCLVFRGVGMLSITLSVRSSSREQGWDGFHRDRLPTCPVSPV